MIVSKVCRVSVVNVVCALMVYIVICSLSDVRTYNCLNIIYERNRRLSAHASKNMYVLRIGVKEEIAISRRQHTHTKDESTATCQF